MKYWQILLINWRKNEKRDGFTIPFILGCQKFSTDNTHNQDVQDLILDIANENSTQIYLKFCLNTGELILGVYDESKSNIPGKYLRFKNGSESNLFLTNFSNELGNTVEEVALELHNRYQKYLDNQEYSKSGRQWGDYSDHELSFIKNSLN